MAHRKRANQSELGRILGVASQTISKFKHEPSFPEFDKDNHAEIYATCVWWYLRKEATPVPSDETLMAGDGSDGLERYRLARAQQEEIKLAEARGQVVKLADFYEASAAVLAPFKRFAEHLKRTEQHELFEMLEEVNAEVLTGLEKLNGHGDANQHDQLD